MGSCIFLGSDSVAARDGSFFGASFKVDVFGAGSAPPMAVASVPVAVPSVHRFREALVAVIVGIGGGVSLLVVIVGTMTFRNEINMQFN